MTSFSRGTRTGCTFSEQKPRGFAAKTNQMNLRGLPAPLLFAALLNTLFFYAEQGSRINRDIGFKDCVLNVESIEYTLGYNRSHLY